jgi:putative PIN family toxin of toxin-antitoxin system
MNHDFRVVVDTNVLISGLFGIKNSPSSKILAAIREQEIILVASPAIIKEVDEVINRPRIIKLLKMEKKERKQVLDGLIARSEVTAGRQLTVPIGRDRKDDKFLACAREGSVDFIITGDRDLLDLEEYEATKITIPRIFVERYLQT